MTTTECLRQVRAKKISLDAKEEREKRLRAIAEGTTQHYTIAPYKNGVADKVGTMVPEILDYCDSLQNDAAGIITYLKSAQGAIDSIKNETHRAALELYYLNGWTWEKIALKFGKTTQTMWRWHKKGIADVKEYGRKYLEELQAELEQEAVRKNGGMCQSYPYCEFCEEPEKFFRKSETPCADAQIRWKKHKQK